MVRELTKASEVDNVMKEGPALIFVRMEGCGWCERYKPVFEAVAKMFELVAKAYTLERSSPAFKAIQKYSPDGGISVFPTTLIVCSPKNVKQLSGSVDAPKLTKESISVCDVFKKHNKLQKTDVSNTIDNTKHNNVKS